MTRFNKWIIGIGLAASVVMCNVQHGFAHEWYDPYCCNDQDCKPIAEHDGTVEVDYVKGEYIVSAKGQVWRVPFTSKRVRLSQDNEYHACILPYGMELRETELRCLYVPPGLS